MDNNNFEKELQNSGETVDNTPSLKESEERHEKQIQDASTSDGAYYNNGPRLPRSEATAHPAKPSAGGQALVFNKEKLAIVIAMGALALILLSVVLLITFCGGATGHKHNYDFTLTKDGEEFVLIGKCTLNGCPKPNYVEKNIGDSVVLSKEVDASCLEGGKKVYSYEKDGVSLVYNEIIGEAKGHSINGVDIQEYRNEDGSLKYTAPYILPYAGVTVTCGKTYDGAFQCPECDVVVPAKVYVECAPKDEWTPVFGKEATCTKKGQEELLCKYCGKVLESRESKALGHDISYMLKKKSSLLLVSYCTRCVDGGSEKQILPTDANLKQEVIAANCTSPTKTIYTYKMDDGKVLETTVESGTTVGKCVVAGKEFTMPTEPVPYNTPGLKYPPNQSEAKCGGIGTGYFVCDVCGKPSLPVEVILPGEHGEVKTEPDTMPTKTKGCTVKVICKDCNQTVKVIGVEAIPDDSNLVGSNYERLEAANDTHGGKYRYTATKDGVNIDFTVTLPKETTP